MANAAQDIIECKQFRDQNAPTLTAYSSKEKVAIEALKQEMIRSGQTCRRLNERWFLILEDKPCKAKFTLENIPLILHEFLLQNNIVWSEENMQQFRAYLAVAEAQLSSTKRVATVTDKKPVKMMLSKVA